MRNEKVESMKELRRLVVKLERPNTSFEDPNAELRICMQMKKNNFKKFLKG